LGAAGGVYVDPNGEVILYGADYNPSGINSDLVHGNGLPFSGDYASTNGFIRGKEFHERHGDAAPWTACPTMNDAWVEFYSERNFDLDEGTGQILRIDYARRQERNYRIFGQPDFNDKAKSVRWCIPSGSSFQVFHDLDFTGPSGLLLGTGHVRGVASFQNKSYPNGGTNLDNSITSGMFRFGVSSSADAIPGAPDPGN